MLFVLIRFFLNNSISSERVEISTIFTSFKKRKSFVANLQVNECVFLYKNGLDPYDGGLCHQAPLLLSLFAWPFVAPFLYILIDLVNSYLLQQLAHFKLESMKKEVFPEPCVVPDDQEKSDSQLYLETAEKPLDSLPKPTPVVPSQIASMYLMNPFALLACVGQSTGVLINFCVLLAVFYATKSKTVACMLWLGLATYLDLYSIAYLPICILLLKTSWLKSVFLYSSFISIFLGLSWQLIGSWNFIPATYGVMLSASELQPNIGLFWYFFIEVFEQFKVFFICLFQFVLFIFILPVAIRFQKHPLFAVYVTSAILAIFKPYPSISDAALAFGFLSLHPEVMKYSNYKFLLLHVILYATVLGPLFFNLWIYANAGNSNFFYAITLLWALGNATLLMDVMYGFMMREWERSNPGWRMAHIETYMT